VPSGSLRLRRLTTDELTTAEVGAIRSLLVDAFGTDPEERFTEEDWLHSVGGSHFVLDEGGRIVATASVVERELRVGGRPVRTGYVEAMATLPDRQGEGFGTRVMDAVGAFICERYELGALGTGSHHFYERLGWRAWTGPSSVRTEDGIRATPEDDGYILVLLTPATPRLDEGATIETDWRPGDAW
jgi:aminoglycoside 2'-N-acetyltransferase I